MSKLRINKKIKKFFRNNKLRIISLTMSCSLTMNVVYATMNIPMTTDNKKINLLTQETVNNHTIIKSKFKVYKKSKK